MNEMVKMHFFKIGACGYYKGSSTKATLMPLSETLRDLQAWSTSRPLEATCPFAPDEDHQQLPVYCFSINTEGTHGDYLLTTWNELHSSKGRVPSVRGKDPVGSATVQSTKIAAGSIPGFPTYFWVVPSRNIMATILFDKEIVNGRSALHHFIGNFLASQSSAVVLSDEKEGPSEGNIAGYRAKPGDQPVSLSPKFWTSSYKLPGRVAFLKSHRGRISKLIHKRSFKNAAMAKKESFMTRLLKFMDTEAEHETPRNLSVRYEVNFRPTEHGLKELIARSDDMDDDIEELGLKITGVPEIFWLKHSRAKATVQLDVKRLEGIVVEGGSLLMALTKNRDTLLAALKG